MLWEPLTLALAASTCCGASRSTAAAAKLLASKGASVVVAEFLDSLWQERPGAMVLARWALALSLATTLFSRLTDFWPAPLPPGIAGPALAASVAWTGGWLVWSLRQPA